MNRLTYRPVTDLTDNEIRYIVNEIFSPECIKRVIGRDKKAHCVSVDIITKWETEENTASDILDTIYLYEPNWNHSLIECDFSLASEDELKWEQFCLAKGCHPLLKNNPYLRSTAKNVLDIVVVHNGEDKDGICPNCGAKITEFLNSKYCNQCGQELIWSNKEGEKVLTAECYYNKIGMIRLYNGRYHYVLVGVKDNEICIDDRSILILEEKLRFVPDKYDKLKYVKDVKTLNDVLAFTKDNNINLSACYDGKVLRINDRCIVTEDLTLCHEVY